jgi:hypothetical protein
MAPLLFFVIFGLRAECKGVYGDLLGAARVSAHSAGVKVLRFDTDAQVRILKGLWKGFL